MDYFAHSVSGQTEETWERLSVHLKEVSEDAGEHGARFGAGSLATMAGLLHDLGKYSRRFQERLRNSAIKADHSTAGAVWAIQNLPQKWGKVLAHVIAGHHTGLKNDLFVAEGRLERKEGLLAGLAGAAKADGLVLPQSVSKPMDARYLGAEQGFQLAFLTRMIFSCLVDADRTAAARFAAQAQGLAPVEDIAHPSIAALEQALATAMARRQATPTALNALRDDVLRAAIAMAEAPPGVFTLTVPTGGAKTLSSLAFALAHARKHGLDRVIVVIPFTSIIEQTARVYRDALGSMAGAVLEHHSAFEMEDEGRWSADRIGPDRLKLSMERWDHPIIVTTAVQFFESLFSDRTSRCRKLHSLARSVIVLDEAQTMPLPLLRPCVAALKELSRNYGTSVVLCTATQPALTAPIAGEHGFLGGFKAPREIAPDVPALFAALRRVTVRDIGTQADADLARLMEESPQALCIVNQRAHARQLFEAIRHLPGARHLSTCMHSVHRARVLAEIREDLRKERPCRVVATSLVEAGVDLDFPRVFRASAGLDQIAQAAGRCNREGRRPVEDSEVLVFKAAEYDVIQPLKANAEVGAAMLGRYADDPFGPNAMKAFFDMLYWRKGRDELDRGRVLQSCAERVGDLNFPFETIAAEMRFIEDVMVPVIVAKEDDGKVAGLVHDLRYAKGVGGIAGKLGRYTVGVPRSARAALVAAKVAEVIRPEEFELQFVVLLNLDLYTDEVGLDWNDLSFRSTDGLILS
jgi:CRISPR-associated endonuclease/helicase Cas3